MNDRGIVIGTSISPHERLEIQSIAIESWLSHGFKVISVNCSEETQILRNYYPAITAIEHDRTGHLLASKPVIFINDILHYLRQSNGKILGIINSDIFIHQTPDLPDKIIELCKGRLVFGPRMEVPAFNALNGQHDPFGFDYFFFDHSLVPIWPETNFCLGMPFWDHWFPLAALLEKKKITKMIGDQFRHIPHPVSRDDSFFSFNDYFVSLTISQIKNNQIGFGKEFDHSSYELLRNSAIECENQLVTENDKMKRYEELAIFFDELSKYVINFINDRSETINL